MILTRDVELIDGAPLAYVRSINSIIASDLHLGYEGVAARAGVFVPAVNLKRILKSLSEALALTGASNIIITGDIKNEFSGVRDPEFNELYDFAKFARGRSVSLTLIKGNHDNFVERYGQSFKMPIFREEALIGRFLFAHGDKLPRTSLKGVDMLVIGHEHPSIGVTNGIGKRERLRCFLYGRYGGAALLVMPAMNYFASGVEVNSAPRASLLSPILRRARLGSMHAIAIGYGSTVDFGKVSDLHDA